MLQEKDYLKRKAKELLLEILSIYTPSGEEHKALDFFEKVSKDLNLKLTVTSSNSYLLGEGKILLTSHVDTVPGFIEPKAEGEVIYGRGAVDDKGPLIAMLLATHILNEKGCKVMFGALADEENKSAGARELVRSGYSFDYVINGEPTNTTGIVIEYRGLLHVDIRCKGVSEHSSSSKDNLILNLARKILDISKLPSDYDTPSIVPTIFHAGNYVNITPSEGTIHFDIRYSARNSKQDLLSILKKEFNDCEIEITEDIEPIKVDVSNVLVRAIMRGLIKQSLKPTILRKQGTSDMNILAKITNNIVTYGPGNSRYEHTNEERISLEEIFISINTYINAIEELCLKRK
ncbi:MAG: N-acetyl-lysine deacetylase [Sulfolobaceae archaeon]|nr:N-acetyl-lysine deacetylase [Sulfolobaceae archaeon]